jgi:thiol-disulfide isomerase/thioredoxin
MTVYALILAATLGAADDYDGFVLEFSATWCGPCQQMSPLVSRLERQGCPIRKIDIDQNRDLAKRFNIERIPTFVLIVSNKEVSRVSGAVSEQTLKEMLGKIPARPAALFVENKPPRDARELPAERRPSRSTRPEEKPDPREAEIARNEPPAKKKGFSLPFFPKKENPSPAADDPELIARAKVADPEPVSEKPAVGNPLAATVRIRLRDEKGEDFGTGTIVDSRVGRTLILTCGHMFRHWNRQSLIQVDLFRGERTETFIGTRVDHDAESDVGLIAINSDEILPVCRIAPPGIRVLKGMPVVSAGCGGGERPTIQQHKVTAINRYLGPDNLECSGVPVLGRSGGGLFTPEGVLIGVCNAADSHHREGLYAGLSCVHNLLDRSKLSYVYRVAGPSETNIASTLESPSEPPRERERTPANEFTGTDGIAMESHDLRSESPEGELPSRLPESLAAVPSRMTAQDGAALREALEQVEGAEVICIVRPIDQPRAASRVIVINRASDRFLTYLTGEVRTQSAIHNTTLSQPSGSGDIVLPRFEIAADLPDNNGPQPYRRSRRAAAQVE